MLKIILNCMHTVNIITSDEHVVDMQEKLTQRVKAVEEQIRAGLYVIKKKPMKGCKHFDCIQMQQWHR